MDKKNFESWQSRCIDTEAFGHKFQIVSAGNRLLLDELDLSLESGVRHLHNHFSYEIFFAVNSEFTLLTEEKPLHYKNTVVIIPPKVKHCSIKREKGCFCMLTVVDSDVQKKLQEKITAPTEISPPKNLDFYVRELSRVWQGDDEMQIHLSAIILRLVFSGIIEPKEIYATAENNSVIGIIDSYINSHYNEKITLSLLSEKVHLCEKQVSRIIMREYSKPLFDLLWEKRISQAEILLRTTDRKISDVISQVTDQTEMYFYTCFKKHMGMTPTEYRRMTRT